MHYSPVLNYEGLYEVSTLGTVRSLDRSTLGRDGTIYPFKGKVLHPSPNKQVEYLQVSLWKYGQGVSHYVHRLVAEAHIPNPLELPEVNHKNGDRFNNQISNLEWVNSSGNSQHAADTGLRVYTNRLSKSEFFECLQSVIDGESYCSLSQRVPYQVPFLSVKLRRLAKELGIEDNLNESIRFQRVQRARINGAKNKPNRKSSD